MAQMYPDHLPGAVRGDPKRKAEMRVYNALRDALDDDYRVFYSVAWTAKIDGRVRDGETDFIIAHPRHGLLVAEVKGGEVARDGKSGRWRSTDRAGKVHNITDPIEQARNAKYLLRDWLREKRELSGTKPFIGHAVILPDSGEQHSEGGFGLPLDVFMFREHLKDSGRRIDDIFEFWRSSGPAKPLNSATLQLLIDQLAPTFDLKAPLSTEAADTDYEIRQLTESQFSLLDRLARMRKAQIVGGAGTGKTVLLAEKATRLASDGLKTLVLCFNELLAKDLNQRIGHSRNLRALTFHDLCRKFADGAKLKVPLDFEGYPDLLLAALDQLGVEWRFDALLVDEAQDFHEDWWTPLMLLLKDFDEAVVYLFRDDNQRLYGQGARAPEEFRNFPEIPLTENLRNCREIFALASRYYDGEQKLISKGPKSPFVPQLIPSNGDREIAKSVGSLLHKLVRDPAGGLACQDIVILTGRGREKSVLGRNGSIGPFVCTRDPWSIRGEILCETVFRFKGLERPFVILTELDELHPKGRAHALYVGLTRARIGLAVVASARVISEMSSA